VPQEGYLYSSLPPLCEREISTLLARVGLLFVTVQKAIVGLQCDPFFEGETQGSFSTVEPDIHRCGYALYKVRG
jgi:hypothetical protein